MNYKQGMFGKDHAFRDLLYPILLANSKGNSLAISNTYSGWSTNLKFQQRSKNYTCRLRTGLRTEKTQLPSRSWEIFASNLIRETFRRRLVPVKRVANGNEARWSLVWMSWQMGCNPVTFGESHDASPWDESCIFTYIHEWLILMVNIYVHIPYTTIHEWCGDDFSTDQKSEWRTASCPDSGHQCG